MVTVVTGVSSLLRWSPAAVRARKVNIAATAIAAFAATSGQAQTFTPLGDLPGAPFYSVVNALSNDGSTVVGVGNEFSTAYRWTTTTGMQALSSATSSSFGVSPDGVEVVGTVTDATFTQNAFSWDVTLAELPTPPDTSLSGAVSVTDSSRSVGFLARPVIVTIPGVGDLPVDEFVAVRWDGLSAPVVLDAGDLPGGDPFSLGVEVNFAQARHLSSSGDEIVGWATSASGPEAFLWTPSAGMQGLGDLPGGGFNSRAEKITPDGTKVLGIGESAIGCEGFLWQSSTGLAGLGAVPPGLPNAGGGWEGGAMTSDASIITGRSSCGVFDPLAIAVIWDAANGVRSLKDYFEDDLGLDLTGWQLMTGFVSGDGQVFAGDGINPSGDREAWVATVPEPTGGVIACALTLWMLNRRGGRWIDATVHSRRERAKQRRT